jgi:hypothetical protein
LVFPRPGADYVAPGKNREGFKGGNVAPRKLLIVQICPTALLLTHNLKVKREIYDTNLFMLEKIYQLSGHC